MSDVLTNTMRLCRNFFQDGYIDDQFTIAADGKITPFSGIVDGQYIAVQGSLFNDGVYATESGKLIGFGGKAESFKGRVWTLHPPRSFLSLCDKISTFESENKKSGLQSESFGNYSRSFAMQDGLPIGWDKVFWSDVQPYFRMFTEVRI